MTYTQQLESADKHLSVFSSVFGYVPPVTLTAKTLMTAYNKFREERGRSLVPANICPLHFVHTLQARGWVY